ncbi:MAG: hypothetical protein Q8O12_00745 [Candidatus Omnitrophota bacterium]|nr:hypothetical protein [Candidatus Omnitrophota bacterium]
MIGQIRYLIFKVLNAIFGSFRIFIVLLGWFLVITGIIFLSQPERARNKMVGMGFWQIKVILFSIALTLAVFVASLTDKISGILSLALFILCIIAIIRGYLSLKKKTYNKISAWFAKVPMKYLKAFAIIQIAIGIIMIVFNKRLIF